MQGAPEAEGRSLLDVNEDPWRGGNAAAGDFSWRTTSVSKRAQMQGAPEAEGRSLLDVNEDPRRGGNAAAGDFLAR
jgi:hypothetical protein